MRSLGPSTIAWATWDRPSRCSSRLKPLHRDYLPSSWEIYRPTVWDFAQFFGSIGLFLTLLFLFVRCMPVISIFELRELVHETSDSHALPEQR